MVRKGELMEIKELYSNDEPITFESYLHKCGVSNVEYWMSCSCCESSEQYDNVDKVAKELIEFAKGGDVNVN